MLFAGFPLCARVHIHTKYLFLWAQIVSFGAFPICKSLCERYIAKCLTWFQCSVFIYFLSIWMFVEQQKSVWIWPSLIVNAVQHTTNNIHITVSKCIYTWFLHISMDGKPRCSLSGRTFVGEACSTDIIDKWVSISGKHSLIGLSNELWMCCALFFRAFLRLLLFRNNVNAWSWSSGRWWRVKGTQLKYIMPSIRIRWVCILFYATHHSVWFVFGYVSNWSQFMLNEKSINRSLRNLRTEEHRGNWNRVSAGRVTRKLCHNFHNKKKGNAERASERMGHGRIGWRVRTVPTTVEAVFQTIKHNAHHHQAANTHFPLSSSGDEGENVTNRNITAFPPLPFLVAIVVVVAVLAAAAGLRPKS